MFLSLKQYKFDPCNICVDEEIHQCRCPPGTETYVNDDGMDICVSCGGWVGAST